MLLIVRCIEKDNFDCKLQVFPLPIAFVANSIGGIFLKRRQSVFPLFIIGFVCRLICGILSMTLYMFVVALACPLFRCLPCAEQCSPCSAGFVVVFYSVVRAEFQVGILTQIGRASCRERV